MWPSRRRRLSANIIAYQRAIKKVNSASFRMFWMIFGSDDFFLLTGLFEKPRPDFSGANRRCAASSPSQADPPKFHSSGLNSLGRFLAAFGADTVQPRVVPTNFIRRPRSRTFHQKAPLICIFSFPTIYRYSHEQIKATKIWPFKAYSWVF